MTTTNIKFCHKLKALEMIAMVHGSFTQQVDMTNVGEPIITLFRLPDNRKNPA